MSAIEKALLSRAEARSLTDEVKNDAERLWRKLVELYEGGAHEVLGYKSWGAYFKAEFGGSERRGYQLLDAGKLAKELTASPVNHGSLRSVPNERQARELAPLKNVPQEAREAWAEVTATHAEPTAADVREVVTRRHGGDIVDVAPRVNLKVAARAVILSAVREGRHYKVPFAAMEALMRAAGEGS